MELCRKCRQRQRPAPAGSAAVGNAKHLALLRVSDRPPHGKRLIHDSYSEILFDLLRLPLAQALPPLDDRLQRFKPQSGPERFERQDAVPFDVAEAYVVAETAH